MANTYHKYKLRRQVQGRECLADQRWEAAVELLANGTPKDQITTIIEDFTLDELNAMLKEVAVINRLAYRKRMVAKKHYRPQTPDEMIQYAKDTIITVLKKADRPKDRLDAAKALNEIALKERASGMGGSATKVIPGADDLAKAFEENK